MTTGAIATGPSLDTLPEGMGKVVDSNFQVEQTANNEVQITKGAAPAQRPEGVPEKFWDAKTGTVNTAALLASYSELEKKQSATPPKAEGAKPEDSGKPNNLKMGEQPQDPANSAGNESEPKAGEKPKEGEEPKKEAPKVDFEALGTELATNGKLSDESYANLEAAGYGREMTDQFIAGQQAIQELNTLRIHNAAGGQEAYESLVKWGTDNLTKAEHESFNKAQDIAIATGDSTALGLLIEGIKAKMGGGEPNYVAGKGGNTTGVQGYQLRSEMTADMNNPLYRTDPNFVAQVQARLAATTAF